MNLDEFIAKMNEEATCTSPRRRFLATNNLIATSGYTMDLRLSKNVDVANRKCRMTLFKGERDYAAAYDQSQSFGRDHQDWSARDRFLLTGDDSNGSVSVFEVLVPVGQKLVAPAHKNDAYEEILYGIEGVLTWTVDGTPIEVGPGQALCIPRGTVHRFDNLGSKDVKQLAVITPAIMGPAYFREAAEVIGTAGGPPDRTKMMDVFRRHGMTVAEPPPAK